MLKRDRREALKLLAGGTAAAIGTSIITTTSAHADRGTVKCIPSVLPTSINSDVSIVRAFATNNDEWPQVTVSTGTGSALNGVTCPAGTKDYRFRYSIPTAPTTGANAPRIARNSDQAIITGTFDSATVVRIVNSNATNALTSTGSYTLRIEVQVRCVGTKTCWRCLTYQTTFTWTFVNGSGESSVTGQGSTSTTAGATNCPT